MSNKQNERQKKNAIQIVTCGFLATPAGRKASKENVILRGPENSVRWRRCEIEKLSLRV
jgi:hypothetical protein